MPHKSLQKEKHAPIDTNASHMDTGSTKLLEAPDLDGKLDYPIMKNAARIPLITKLKKPSEEAVIKSHQEVGLKLSAGSMLHPKRVSRAIEKFNRQKELLGYSKVKYEANDRVKDEMVDSLSNIDLSSFMYEDSKKSADENLFDHYDNLKSNFAYIESYEESINEDEEMSEEDRAKHLARIKTLADIRTFYEVWEALMLNKYYAHLPRAEMMKLSETTLMVRLGKLYEEEPQKRNVQLIDFYQNLLRLKRLGINGAKDVKEREAAYLKELKGEPETEARDAAAESKKLVDTYKRFLKNLDKKKGYLSEDDLKKRRYQFFSVCGKDIRAFRNTINAIGSDAARKVIEDYDEYNFYHEREEFEFDYADQVIENVLNDNPDAHMLEKRNEAPEGIELSEKQKEGIRIIQSFLLRRSSQDANASESFVSSLAQAPPEQQLTAFYLVEKGRQAKGIGADFYSAITDYVPDLGAFRKKVNKHFWGGTNWNVISDAVQAAKDLGADIKIHAELTLKAEEAEAALEETQKDPGKFMDQGKSAVEALSYHAASLKQLYALAGMHEDMPPDLAEDRKLREKMYSEYKQIGELAKTLSDIIKDHPEVLAKLDKKETGDNKTKIKEEKGKSAFGKGIGFAAGVNKYIAPTRLIEGGASVLAGEMDKAAKAFTEGNIYYTMTRGSVLNLSAVISIVDSIYGLFLLSGQTNMTLAEELVKTSGKVTSIVSNLAMTGSGVLGTLTSFNVVEKTAEDVVAAGSVFTGVTMAGLVASVATNSLELGRTVSNGKELKRAKEKLESRTENREKDASEKRLERYLKHQDRETGRQGVTATVNLTKDAASTAAMVMAATGVLLPIAATIKVTSGVIGVFHNFIFDRSWKKDNIKRTVDEYLEVDKLVSELRDDPNLSMRLRNMGNIALEDHVRQEALGKLGFTSYKQCYKLICKQFAELLYTKLFCNACSSKDEWNMYNQALAGLGMKRLVYKKNFGDNPQPSMQAILARMYA